MSEVKLVRMKSGEELIGKVSESENGYRMEKPTILVPTGNGSVGLMPYMPYTKAVDEGLDLPGDFVLFVLELHTELVNHYNTNFGNGLFVPEKGPVGVGGLDTSNLKLTE